jgi:predicted esterase
VANTDPDPDWLVVALHGYGGTGAEMVRALSAARGAAAVAIEGPNGPCDAPLARAGRAWYPITSRAPLIARHARGLVPAVVGHVADAQQRHRLTAERTCLVGFSQGASVVAAVLAHASVCRRAVLVCGRVPGEDPMEPAPTDLLVVTGGRDRFVRPDDVRADLGSGRFGSPRMVVLPDLGHEFSDEVARLTMAHATRAAHATRQVGSVR